MIGVTGATGKLGQMVVEGLLKRMKPEEVAVVVRNPEKARAFAERGVTVRQGDYSNPGGLKEAFAGVTKLLLISSPERGVRVAQHNAVIDAAKRATVQLLGFTSLLHADRSKLQLMEDFRATEKAIRDSGLPFVLLRNAWYTENKTMFIAPALKQGVFPGAAQDGRFSTATRQDYAEAAAAALTTDGHENRTYELAGDRSFSLPEFVAKTAELAHEQLQYKNIGEQAFAELLRTFGIPEQAAKELAESEAAADAGEHHEESKDLSKLIGRPATPREESIANALAASGR